MLDLFDLTGVGAQWHLHSIRPKINFPQEEVFFCRTIQRHTNTCTFLYRELKGVFFEIVTHRRITILTPRFFISFLI